MNPAHFNPQVAAGLLYRGVTLGIKRLYGLTPGTRYSHSLQEMKTVPTKPLPLSLEHHEACFTASRFSRFQTSRGTPSIHRNTAALRTPASPASNRVCLVKIWGQREGERRSAKATEVEAGQRPVPPRATPAQRAFCLHSQSLRAMGLDLYQTHPRVCLPNKPAQRKRAGEFGQDDRGGGGPAGPCRRGQRRPSALDRLPRRAPAMGWFIWQTDPKLTRTS